MASTGNALDVYVLYRFLKGLLNKYTEWEAYKTGVIDDKGKILVPDTKRTGEQKRALTMFDLVILHIRHLLDDLPGGPNRVKNAIAALWALKEGRKFVYARTLNEDRLNSSFAKYLLEDGMGAGAVAGPANNVGSGNIAGAAPGESPPVDKKRQKKIQAHERTPGFKDCMMGARKNPALTEELLEEGQYKKYRKMQVPLTPEEHKKVMDAKAVWHFNGGSPSAAIWKTVNKDGKTEYHCNTHRCWLKAPTLGKALTNFRFVKTTA